MHKRIPIGIGIVGLGRAANAMLPSFLAHPGVRVVAAADPRPEARAHFVQALGGRAYSKLNALLTHPEVDVVYIATPHQFHAPQAILAAQHGKHVIVEKPMALTMEECGQMIEQARRGNVHLLVGHTHSYDPPVRKLRALVASGKFGTMRMINTWNYTDFLYRPRRPEELDTSLGGGILFNQVPHQIDMVRWIGGGRVKSVRSGTTMSDPNRPTEGSHATFLEFEEGSFATVVYSGYDYFDSDEWHEWVGEGGKVRSGGHWGNARRALSEIQTPEAESALRASTGVGGSRQRMSLETLAKSPYHPHFGILIASCDGGDLRLSPRGIWCYTPQGRSEMLQPPGACMPDKTGVIEELYQALVWEKPVLHDGEWGAATVEVCLAILTSARERREVQLKKQVATPALV